MFVRLKPGKEETFPPASRSRIFCFFHVVDVEASSNDEGAWWEGPGQAGQGQGQGQGQGASKAKSSVLSQLSGLENVVFNDFIDDELDSEDMSEQHRHQDSEGVVCMCCCVGVCVCVCVCACARRRYVFVRICICIF